MSKEKGLIIFPVIFVEYIGFSITKVHFGWLRKSYSWTIKTNKR